MIFLFREMKINLEGIDLHLAINNVTMPNIQYMPFNQFEGIPLFLGQMGSGSGIQPFKTVEDYQNWIEGPEASRPGLTVLLFTSEKGCRTGIFFPVAW